MVKRRIHLICNAHLDPVWLWQWPEGAAEALSTFRIAAELCENNETFIFNHNEAVLYEWVRLYEPFLFKRIQKLVKTGQWNIMGGWYLQPDCNMLSGESFVRQILLGKNYFKKYFGVNVNTAINFDPFGHSRGLIQILAKSGYDSYLFGRPTPEYLKLPSENFIWQGFDGSEILACRFKFPYTSSLGKAENKIRTYLGERIDGIIGIVLWGVGNHGGGPSRKDIRDINKFIDRTNAVKILHSTPQKYFKELKDSSRNFPKVAQSLNPWAPGCYTSMIRIKQLHRLLENELYMVEKMTLAASVAGLMDYPRDRLRKVVKDLAFIEFHDILPGSCVAPAEMDAMNKMGHGLDILGEIKTEAFFALSKSHRKARKGFIPILVYNPHPFKIKTIVECEFNLPDFDSSNKFYDSKVYQSNCMLPTQVEKEISNLKVNWRKRIAFTAELEPFQINRFDCLVTRLSKRPVSKMHSKNGKFVFRNRDIHVEVSTRTGLIDKYRIKGRDFIARDGFKPLIIKDNADPWGMTVTSFTKIAGQFKLASKTITAKILGYSSAELNPVRVIEKGDVRTIIESILCYDQSFIIMRYKLPEEGTEIEVEVRVLWNQKDQMLKLSVPMCFEINSYLGQVAYGVDNLPIDGTEAVAQKWVAATSIKKGMAFTCINDGTYASNVSGSDLRLTLLRSPAHSADSAVGKENIFEESRFIPRMDQGEHLFHFWLNGGKIRERRNAIDREALSKNEKPYALSFFPSGKGKKNKPFAILSDNAVQITAMKLAENDNSIIIRLFEPTGHQRKTTLILPALNKKINLTLGAFEIKTLKINRKSHKFTDLMEKPV
ncbi:MAG: hypothetical protein A2Y10_10115 [Planctomycetes bacterium GWF2_41_51]|nr:MAG: hypothetical protein A2Y10_10115 [Planctomycetes bacterium GWF2_41_51]HBG27706.1 alpha-mannosidase [Phycisphaerales bacterium]